MARARELDDTNARVSELLGTPLSSPGKIRGDSSVIGVESSAASRTADIEFLENDEESYWDTPLYKLYYRRTLWLVGLLLLQSYASLILEAFEGLLKKHLVITLFLPMLIGAGGNASSQSAMLVVRGLATGEISRRNVWKLVVREYSLALVIGLTMMVVSYIRVWLFHSSEGNSAALAVSAATLAVMLLAIGLGTLIPVGLECMGIDPAHAGPVVAVLVDLCGVAIICSVCYLVLGV